MLVAVIANALIVCIANIVCFFLFLLLLIDLCNFGLLIILVDHCFYFPILWQSSSPQIGLPSCLIPQLQANFSFSLGQVFQSGVGCRDFFLHFNKAYWFRLSKSFINTVRYSIPHPAQRYPLPPHPTYSTTVLHPSLDGFFIKLHRQSLIRG